VLPLSLGATAHLLRTRVDPQTARRTVQRIHQQSGGNPFYSLHLARASDPDRLPTSLRDVIESRLVAADPAALPAVERTAVVGPAGRSSYDDGGALDAAVAAGCWWRTATRSGSPIPCWRPLPTAGSRPPADETCTGRQLQRAGAEERARHLALAAAGQDPATAALLEERPGWPARGGHPRQPPSWRVMPCD
jgi:hypothetical protein